METNHFGYRVNKNLINYAVKLSDKFEKEIEAGGLSEYWISYFMSPIELKIGDKILISPYSNLNQNRESVINDIECLKEMYGVNNGELMCHIVDIYFDLSYYSEMDEVEFDEFNNSYDENLISYYFLHNYRNSMLTIVIEPTCWI